MLRSRLRTALIVLKFRKDFKKLAEMSWINCIDLDLINIAWFRRSLAFHVLRWHLTASLCLQTWTGLVSWHIFQVKRSTEFRFRISLSRWRHLCIWPSDHHECLVQLNLRRRYIIDHYMLVLIRIILWLPGGTGRIKIQCVYAWNLNYTPWNDLSTGIDSG